MDIAGKVSSLFGHTVSGSEPANAQLSNTSAFGLNAFNRPRAERMRCSPAERAEKGGLPSPVEFLTAGRDGLPESSQL